MPTITPTDQETALRLRRAGEPLSPPDDAIRLLTLPSRFEVSDALMTAYTADLALPDPPLPNCRGANPCYSAQCGEGQTAATGATAGTPGGWTGGFAPASVQDLQDGSPTVVASPTTAWTVGQYVQTGTAGAAGQAHWDGDSWAAGTAPAPPVVPSTGATAGVPGTWTPAGSTPPAITGMAGIVATPATAWTTGQYVQTSTAGGAGRAYWNGTSWVTGSAAP